MPHPFRLSPLFHGALLVVLGFAAGTCEAGPERVEPMEPSAFTLRSWQEREGLPSDDMLGVTQDAHGYLWAVSKTTLARFDGTTFLPVPVPEGAVLRGFSAPPAGPAQDGELLLPGTRDRHDLTAGYHLWRRGAFHFVPEPLLAEKSPQAAFHAADGTRWIGCADGTLLWRQGAARGRVDTLAGSTSKRPWLFASDAAGRTWALWNNAVHRLDRTGAREVPLPYPETELKIFPGRSGGVWLVARTTLYRGDAAGSGFTEIRRLPETLRALYLQAALEDRQGRLWFGTRSQGLHRLAGEELRQVPTSSDDIAGLCDDGDDSLWIATDGGGLNRLRVQAHQLFDRERGLHDNYSYTVAADPRGALWLANRDGGVARVESGNVDPLARRAGWPSFSARSVHPAPDGRVWIASGLGVFHTDPEKPESLIRVPELAAWRDVRSTFVARNGDYWLALEPERIGRWRAGELTVFDRSRGFDGREVRAFAEDAAGRIWLGAANGALFRSTADGFERVDFPDAAESGALQVIHFDADGRLMIGTTRRGVLMFAPGDFRAPRALDREHGLPNSNVSQLLLDDHGRYWFATRGGIFWAHVEQVRAFAAGRANYVHTIMVGKDDGVPPLSCLGIYQPAAGKAPDGTLWFATRRGVLRTDPAVVAQGRDTVPPVELAALTFDDAPQPLAARVELPAPVRKVQLRLAALNLAMPESILLRVRLEGFDEGWTVLGPDRTVTYPRLPPGRYVLAVRVSHGGARWHLQPALLTLIVPTPWWQTWWFLLAAATAVLAALGFVIRTWSHRRLQRRLRQAEQARAIERERTRIARDIHDDIGATLTRISLLTQTAKQQQAAPSEPLDKIHDATRAITRSLDEIVWAVNPRHDNLESLVYYLANFAQEFLAAAGMRCRLEAPNPTPAIALSSQLRHNLFLSCREALHNAVKHSGATTVTLQLEVQPAALTLRIVDNGRGLDAAPAGARTPDRIAAGNGLANLRQHLADLHGECTLATAPTGGTVVTLRVPLPSTHPDENPPRHH